MNLSELIARIGDENVRIQVLDEVIEDARQVKGGGTRITFFTKERSTTEIARGTGRQAIVVWFEPDDWRRAVADAKREVAAAPISHDCLTTTGGAS